MRASTGRVKTLPSRPVWRSAAAAATVLALGLIMTAAVSCGRKKPENVVIISVDALRSDALRDFNPEAPALPVLDELARKSRIFTRAYTSASWTLPAHGSLFTGLYPDRHGAALPTQKLSPAIPNLAARLKASGLTAAAFTDGGYISASYGFASGFDRYDSWTGPDWDGSTVPREGAFSKLPGTNLFDRGVAFIKGRKSGGRGFFLFLHTYIVHDYFKVHSWAVEKLPPYQDKGTRTYLECILGRAVCSDDDWDRLEALYLADLARLDRGIGLVIEALKEKGLLESTLVVVLSDHGEGFEPERGRIHHGGRLHEDLTRIPLLVSGPGVIPGRSDTPVSLVDVMPTILDYTGVEIPEGLDGLSFAGALAGKEENSPRPIYAMEHYHWWDKGRRWDAGRIPDKALSISVIKGDDWYIRDWRGEELYLMSDDPRQSRNLIVQSSVGDELRGLAKSREQYRPTAPTMIRDKELEERLRSLGYIH